MVFKVVVVYGYRSATADGTVSIKFGPVSLSIRTCTVSKPYTMTRCMYLKIYQYKSFVDKKITSSIKNSCSFIEKFHPSRLGS